MTSEIKIRSKTVPFSRVLLFTFPNLRHIQHLNNSLKVTFIYKVYQDGHRTKNTQQMARKTTHSGTTKRVVSHKTHAQAVYFVYNCVSAPNNYLISLPSGGMASPPSSACGKMINFGKVFIPPLPFALTIPSRSVATRPGSRFLFIKYSKHSTAQNKNNKGFTTQISFRFPRFLFR